MRSNRFYSIKSDVIDVLQDNTLQLIIESRRGERGASSLKRFRKLLSTTIPVPLRCDAIAQYPLPICIGYEAKRQFEGIHGVKARQDGELRHSALTLTKH